MAPPRVARALNAVALLLLAACSTACSSPRTSEPVATFQSAVSSTSIGPILQPPPSGRVGGQGLGPPAATHYPSPYGCSTPVSYYGGPIIESPEVVQVSWNNPTSSVATSVESYLQTWWPAIVSPQARYLGWLRQYFTEGRNGKDDMPGSNQMFSGSGTYEGLFPITPSPANQTTTLTDSAIAAELAAQIGAGNLPQPTFDATGNDNTIYMIDFPPDVTDISLTFAGATSQSCSAFCAYHSGTTYNGNVIYYGVFPDVTSACTSCAPDGVQPDIGMSHSHELGEAMTDAQIFLEALTQTSTDFVRPGGWDAFASGCSEIGDSCAWPSAIPTVTYNGQNYYVQGLWDNMNRDCETSYRPAWLAPVSLLLQ